MVRGSILGLCIALSAPSAFAQAGTRAPLSTIRGLVRDSITATPLAHAEVQAIGADPTRPFVAVTDSLGWFEMRDVPHGRYAITFFHEVLEELALGDIVSAISVERDTVLVRLATPSAKSVLRATCGENAATDSTALLIGSVVNEATGRVAHGANVIASWFEVVVDRGIRSRPRQIAATTDDQGRFGICSIPAGVVTIRATQGDEASGALDVSVDAQALVRLQLAVAQNDSVRWQAPASQGGERAPDAASMLARGNARIHGFVRDSTGRPVRGAQVTVRGSGRATVSDDRGAYALDSLPSGSQMVEVRAIGYAPSRKIARLHVGSTDELALNVGEQVVLLATMHVEGSVAANSGFAARRARGTGYFLSGDELQKLSAWSFVDIARKIPGLRTRPSATGTVLRWRDGCTPSVYLNGVLVNMGSPAIRGNPGEAVSAGMGMVTSDGFAEDVDFIVDPRTITAIEVYPPHAAPLRFADRGSCATVLVWAGGPPG